MENITGQATQIHKVLEKHSGTFHTVVPFDAGKFKLLKMDFTAANTALTDEILNDTDAFSQYVRELLGGEYKFGIGGYGEHRTIYSRSGHFDGEEEPRRLHLGIDIWGPAGTPIYAPLDGQVHSFAFNNNYGDYGATIILLHELDGVAFKTLYGHLSVKDLEGLMEGQVIHRGTEFAHFGEPKDNGHWPPHLHLQVIKHMEGMRGDYHGVCRYSARESYLANCPDPDLILQMMQYAHQ